MTPIRFTEDQYDMLMEVVNQAMGLAGADLAKLLKSFVDLTVPAIEITAAEHVVDKILERSVFSETETVSLFRQTFSNPALMKGESIVIFNRETREKVAEILGCADDGECMETTDFMMELSNLMVGACLNSISQQLFGLAMRFSPPEPVSEDKSLLESVYERFKRRKLKWDYTLISKITFTLKDRSFKSDLVIFISQEAIKTINEALDKLLAEYE
ncbi:MAG: hypothetical protein HUN04_07380 [Desulfobacter sp.]|nr:MAG: hypothetical protein HUN04_07380 [Desulfobacter sp.]